MGRLAGYLISGTSKRAHRVVLWLVVVVIFSIGAAWIAAGQVAQNMRAEIAHSLANYDGLRANIISTFTVMDERLTSDACEPDFLAEMRRIAFLPDGLNELLYAPGNIVLCSSNRGRLPAPIDLGTPEIDASGPFAIALWLDRDLGFLGLDGLVGSIARRGAFAIVVPPQIVPAAAGPDWMEQELVYRADNGDWLHRTGTAGLHERALGALNAPLLALLGGGLYQVACEPAGQHCVAGRTELGALLPTRWPAVLVVALLVGVMALWVVQQISSFVRHYWSFEQRFLRRLDKGSVLCAYQPQLNLRSDTITGCEVLARWRDIDGSIVPPDRFLHIIEKHGLTERFTRLVVAHAHADLVSHLGADTRLQVSFNIFPRDLDADRLIPIFAPFLSAGSRLDVVVELVETAEVKPETAQAEIERLRAAGIGTFIDDFGAGYSSMHNLAALSIDGVKLDRSFAMAPDNSVMARMLEHAIDLVEASGHPLIVEGVETPRRLAELRANGKVDVVQGYGIARPLMIDAFVAFLHENDPSPTQKLVA